MTVYLGTYFAASISSFCYSKCKDKYFSFFFLLATFAILFLPLAFRYNVGTDYENYVRIVGRILEDHKWYKLEYGWYPIVWLIRYFSLNIQFFFIIPAFISICIIFHVVPKRYFWFCIPAYICVSWINSFSLVRQAFAAVVFLLAIKAHCERRYFYALFWGIVASLFHASLIVLLLLLPFTLLKWKIFSPCRNVILFVSVCFVFIITPSAKILMNKVVAVTPYARYIDSIFSQKTEMGTGLGVLLKEVIFLLVLFLSSRNITAENANRYKLICFYTFIFGISHLLAAQIHIFGRVFHLFDPFYVFMLISIYEGGSRWKKLAVLFIRLSMFILYIKLLKDNPSSALGGLGVVPYESILAGGGEL